MPSPNAPAPSNNQPFRREYELDNVRLDCQELAGKPNHSTLVHTISLKIPDNAPSLYRGLVEIETEAGQALRLTANNVLLRSDEQAKRFTDRAVFRLSIERALRNVSAKTFVDNKGEEFAFVPARIHKEYKFGSELLLLISNPEAAARARGNEPKKAPPFADYEKDCEILLALTVLEATYVNAALEQEETCEEEYNTGLVARIDATTPLVIVPGVVAIEF